MKANERSVRTGGLFRCCLHTLGECEEEKEVGDTLDCKFERPNNQNMVLAEDGVWEWNSPKAT
jgi:hypothetical protein